VPDSARNICWIGRMTRDANQSTGKSDAAKITSQLSKGLPNQRSAQALAPAVIATMTINSSASLLLRLKCDRSGAAQGSQVKSLHAAV
jgi:hypothetical protein